MANEANKIVKFVRCWWPVMAVIAGIITSFVYLQRDVQHNSEHNTVQDDAITALDDGVDINSRTLIKVETRLQAQGQQLERIETRQETIRKENRDDFERILDKLEK